MLRRIWYGVGSLTHQISYYKLYVVMYNLRTLALALCKVVPCSYARYN